MAYNSYVIMDEKIAVMDTVDVNFGEEWLANITEILGDRKPDYLVVQHMEPDHSANITKFVETYPEAKVVGNAKTFQMIENFFGLDLADKQEVVTNNGTLSLGSHELTFDLHQWYTGRKLWSHTTARIRFSFSRWLWQIWCAGCRRRLGM